METKIDNSYGVVPVFWDGKGWQILLVHQISYRGDDFWIFPKGHAEDSETPVDAARRELQEETGLKEVVLDEHHNFEVNYSFIHEGVRIKKRVIYYLGYCHNKITKVSQPQEIKELRWCTLAEAEKIVTHDNSREVLASAKLVLSAKNE